MLIHISDIEKMKKRGVGERIIAYFEKYRGIGANTQNCVYLPKELSEEAKSLGIDEDVVEVDGVRFVWENGEWRREKEELRVERVRTYREYLRSGKKGYEKFLKEIYFQIEKNKREKALELIKKGKKLGAIAKELDLTLDEVSSIVNMNVINSCVVSFRKKAL